MAFTSGRMVGHILASGRIIICMVRAFIPGLMDADTRDSMKWTKSMDMEFTSGQTAVSMKATG